MYRVSQAGQQGSLQVVSSSRVRRVARAGRECTCKGRAIQDQLALGLDDGGCGQARVMAIDPVCGMTVEPAAAAGKSEYQGATYYFCSKHCLHSFEKDPARYAREKAA